MVFLREPIILAAQLGASGLCKVNFFFSLCRPAQEDPAAAVGLGKNSTLQLPVSDSVGLASTFFLACQRLLWTIDLASVLRGPQSCCEELMTDCQELSAMGSSRSLGQWWLPHVRGRWNIKGCDLGIMQSSWTRYSGSRTRNLEKTSVKTGKKKNKKKNCLCRPRKPTVCHNKLN